MKENILSHRMVISLVTCKWLLRRNRRSISWSQKGSNWIKRLGDFLIVRLSCPKFQPHSLGFGNPVSVVEIPQRANLSPKLQRSYAHYFLLIGVQTLIGFVTQVKPRKILSALPWRGFEPGTTGFPGRRTHHCAISPPHLLVQSRKLNKIEYFINKTQWQWFTKQSMFYNVAWLLHSFELPTLHSHNVEHSTSYSKSLV